MEDTCYDKIIGALYESAVNPDSWRATLNDITRWTGANEFHLLRWDSATQQPLFNVHSDGIESAIATYSDYYANIDPRRMLVAGGPAGQVSACQRHFNERYVERNEFYQDFLAAWGMRHSLSSLLIQDGDEQLMLGLVRESERGAFDDGEIARLERLMPHLQRACRLWKDNERMQEQAALGDQAAASKGLGWLGVDRAGMLVHANPVAEQLLRDDDSLAVRGGRVRATDTDDDVRLQSAIAQAARGLPARELTLRGRRSGPHALAVSVVAAAKSRAEVLVMVRPREGLRAPSAHGLAEVFGLTAAEIKVALALLDGKTPAEYAEATGVSIPTVRTHLSAIYAKTCTRRQAEAVQVLRDLKLPD